MKSAIIDKRIPQKAKLNLSKYFHLIEFETFNLTNEYLSGHPDIFFSLVNNKLIYAPNLPQKYIDILKLNSVVLVQGEKEIKFDYPFCSFYNCVISKKLLIHNLKYTDSTILYLSPDFRIDVKQGLTRCSLIALSDKDFITSDKGIKKKLEQLGYNVIFVNPENILLPGLKYGFIGGCAGIDFENKSIYFLGSLNYHEDGKLISNFCKNLGYKIIELYDGKLFDGGSILII